jgi:hypothetical protein
VERSVGHCRIAPGVEEEVAGAAKRRCKFLREEGKSEVSEYGRLGQLGRKLAGSSHAREAIRARSYCTETQAKRLLTKVRVGPLWPRPVAQRPVRPNVRADVAADSPAHSLAAKTQAISTRFAGASQHHGASQNHDIINAVPSRRIRVCASASKTRQERTNKERYLSVKRNASVERTGVDSTKYWLCNRPPKHNGEPSHGRDDNDKGGIRAINY